MVNESLQGLTQHERISIQALIHAISAITAYVCISPPDMSVELPVAPSCTAILRLVCIYPPFANIIHLSAWTLDS